MEALRASLNWLHTWAGVVLGGLLFAIFWMGTLSVFDKEIDRWMAPMTRLAVPSRPIPLDAVVASLSGAAKAASPLYVVPASAREPTVRVSYRQGKAFRTEHFDPRTGAHLADPETLAGTQFIFPFHFELHLHAADLGIWIVGGAGMAMLALCVSGVIIHRKIFVDFFTFRPRKKSRRVVLDLHNVAGVLGLPFHIAITLSGLAIFGSTYFPSGWQALYDSPKALWADSDGTAFKRPASGAPGAAPSLDKIAGEASRLWNGDPVEYLTVTHLGDAAAYVAVERAPDNFVTHVSDKAWFDAGSGALLQPNRPAAPVMRATQFLAGLHLIRFHHWTLRWLYFALGLLGCVLIATGYLFWLESRRQRHRQLGLRGVRVVEGLTIGSVTGMMIATMAFFVANRVLPLGVTVAGVERAAVEVWIFFVVLGLGFVHAWARPRAAWAEQCGLLALLAAAAVALNWVTTGDHVLRTISQRHLWPIAGMDVMLIGLAVLAAYAAARLRRPAPAASA